VREDVGTFLVGIVVLAVLFVLVRPGSQGPSFVSAITGGISNVIQSATGGGTWSQA